MEEHNEEQKNNEKQNNSCCGSGKNEVKGESKGFVSGLVYGLIPHTGCIAFIIFTILGVTAASAIFRPLLMNRYFFHGLILLSLVFATLSAGVYLHKRGMLSVDGVKKKRRYLSVLYGTSVGINLLLFMVIFPVAANMTGASVAVDGMPQMVLKVDIPCPGHAPLISQSLMQIGGVKSVKYRFPDYFDVAYDSSQTNTDEILSIDVFEPYPAIVVSQDAIAPSQQETPQTEVQSGCSNCGGCSGACGGYCTI